MNFINNIVIPLILGFTIYTLIDYLIFRYSEEVIFTQNISTNEITFTKDYQILLEETAVYNYNIIYKNTKYSVLNPNWTIIEIAGWLDSLKNQDYAVTFHFISNGSISKVITNEIIVNPLSNPMTITTFLMSHLDTQKKYFCVITYTALKITF